MKWKLFLLMLAAVLVLSACNQSKTINKKTMDNYLDQEQIDDQQIETIKQLATETDLVTQRERKTMEATPADNGKEPIFPDKMIAGFETRSEVNLQNYTGPLKITDLTEAKISGELGQDGTVDIYYRIPDKKALPDSKVEGEFQAYFQEYVVDRSMQRRILLFQPRDPFLLVLEEGTNGLYSKTFKDINLEIQQQIPETGGDPYLDISFYRQKFSMKPGERLVQKSPNGTVEFYLQTCIYRKLYDLQEKERKSYVRLYMYAVE